MIGGIVSSTILTLAVIPAIYMMWRGRQLSHTRDEWPVPQALSAYQARTWFGLPV